MGSHTPILFGYYHQKKKFCSANEVRQHEHKNPRFFSFWNGKQVLKIFQILIFLISFHQENIQLSMNFQHVSKFAIAHHTLSHNFCSKLNNLFSWAKENVSIIMFWKCKLLFQGAGGVVKLQNFNSFRNNLGCTSHLINKTNNRQPTCCGSNECLLNIGVSLSKMDPNIKGQSNYLQTHYTPHRLWA